MERKEIWNNSYLGVYSDGTVGISDGVGYVDTMEKEESKKLYEALKTIFN